jgi:hypothetical protein
MNTPADGDIRVCFVHSTRGSLITVRVMPTQSRGRSLKGATDRTLAAISAFHLDRKGSGAAK